MRVEDYLKFLERVAPLGLSDEFCEKYKMYDNSGIIVNCGKEVAGVLYTLDLTQKAVEEAKRLKFNLIVTHHPAIYGGITKLDLVESPQARALLECAKNGISVISMHLNFDAAPQGIDYYLSLGLGCAVGAGQAIAAPLSNGGYGRVYNVAPRTYAEYVKYVEKEFSASRILSYGEKNREVHRVASFCGAGCDEHNISFAARNKADVFVSSDIKHHEIVALTEMGISVLSLTHYACENYGFNKIYLKIKDGLKVKSAYFTDTNLL